MLNSLRFRTSFEVSIVHCCVFSSNKDKAKQLLVRIPKTFGFKEAGQLTDTQNEWVFEKTLQPEFGASINQLAYHVKYGPPAIAPHGDVSVVPIQPH